MGIPSFYKHIIQTIAGVTTPNSPVKPEFFGLDLNCAIYYCVRKVQKKTPYTEAIKAKYEADLIIAVIAYIKQMTTLVNPTQTLYIAVDGVAPMAKIKQQRLRRFRSAVQAEEEARIRAEAKGVPYTQQPRWDTNAITPGTQFMKALAFALRQFAKSQNTNAATITTVVSPADEPGEGEQKIMEYIRAHTPKQAVIYGLDADLIVLSLWANATLGTTLSLFREEMEFNGSVKTDALGDEKFLYLLTDQLADALYAKYQKSATQPKPEFLRDFVGLMSLLGNDFVPHGMVLKIKDDGIEALLRMYRDHLQTPFVQQTTQNHWQYNQAALTDLFQRVAQTEEMQILKSTSKKLNARPGMTASKEPEDQAMARYNDQPIGWAVEKVFAVQIQLEDRDKPSWILKPDWKTIYDQEALMGADPITATKQYLNSLAWTLAYYSGAPIDLYWYYPWYLPPRIETVAEYLNTNPLLETPATPRTPLKPEEQLAMVLPQTSFHLLPKEFQALPTLYPHAFPIQWSLFSLGRKILWECEPLIPLIQPMQITTWIETMYDA
jgi:5'-3' exonuclease